MSAEKSYDVYRSRQDGTRGAFEGTYDTVAEVLAHCEEQEKSYAIRVDGKLLSVAEFMERYVGAG